MPAKHTEEASAQAKDGRRHGHGQEPQQALSNRSRDVGQDLLGLILDALPPSLVAEANAFQDASLVFYREGAGDFYDEHHDSWSLG